MLGPSAQSVIFLSKVNQGPQVVYWLWMYNLILGGVLGRKVGMWMCGPDGMPIGLRFTNGLLFENWDGLDVGCISAKICLM